MKNRDASKQINEKDGDSHSKEHMHDVSDAPEDKSKMPHPSSPEDLHAHVNKLYPGVMEKTKQKDGSMPGDGAGTEMKHAS